MAEYSLRYYAPAGSLIDLNLAYESLDYTWVKNDYGEMVVKLPPAKYPLGYFVKDGIFVVMRSVVANLWYADCECMWLASRIHYDTNEQGLETLEVRALHDNHILKRRSVAYENGTAYTDKLDLADNLMKDVVRENYGNVALDVARDLSAYISVEANLGQGAIVGDRIGNKKVMDVLQNFAAASKQNGVPICFDLVMPDPDDPAHLEFRTYKGQRGTDHSASSAHPVIAAREFGNLTAPQAILDYSEEYNYVYAGGNGSGDTRVAVERQDLARVLASPFARSEEFVNYSNITDETTLASAADADLYRGRPRILFNGKLIDTPKAVYGLNFKAGDLITAQYKGLPFDCEIGKVHVLKDQKSEMVEAFLTGEVVL